MIEGRQVLAVLAVVALAGAVAAPADAALQVGIADQHASAFADARLRALGLRVARLVVPWDAATSEPAAVGTWLDAVTRSDQPTGGHP
jgi:hypothetical protein